MGADAPPVVLAIDLGTSGLKVGLVTVHGEVLRAAERPLGTTFGADGGATQDATVWWDEIRGAARGLLGDGVAPDRVVAVAVTGQWGSTVPTRADCAPAGDCLLWMDGRGRHLSEAVLGGPVQVAGVQVGMLAQWLRRSGGVPTATGRDPLGHRLLVEHRMPEVRAATAWYLEPVDHVTARFTGRPAATPMSTLFSWLTDNRDPDRVAYDPVLLRLARADRARLPPLVARGSVVGTVLPGVARDLGLADGVRVLAGLPDLHAAAYGTGCLDRDQAHLALSTTSWLSCPVDRMRPDVVRRMTSVPGATAGSYLLVNSQETAGRCLAWLREAVLAGDGGPASYERLLAEAATVPPGAGGVLFTPWLRGERVPVDDPAARAGFANLSLGTTRAHLVRAVLEGVACNTRWLLDAVEGYLAGPVAGHLPRTPSAGGPRLRSLRVLGGAARSDLWCQIHADVLDVRLERLPDPVTTQLSGMGLYAGVSLGLLRAADVAPLVAPDRVFLPDPVRARHYRAIARELPRTYRRERGMRRRLQRIAAGGTVEGPPAGGGPP